MTKAGNFKKVVRRHAAETGKRYTEALSNLEGVDERMTYDAPDGGQRRGSRGARKRRRPLARYAACDCVQIRQHPAPNHQLGA